MAYKFNLIFEFVYFLCIILFDLLIALYNLHVLILTLYFNLYAFFVSTSKSVDKFLIA